MTRLICLGDSFTEGMSDDLRPDGRHLGWADRVAAGLAAGTLASAPPPITYANLGIRGKRLDQVVTEQLGPALALGPDIITFQGGANDLMRPRTDLRGLYARYDEAVRRISASGARVVLFTTPNGGGESQRFADRIERQFHGFNQSVRAAAAARGATLVDLEEIHVLTDRRLRVPDRLHFNPLGHARVAAAVLAALGVTDPQILGGPLGWWGEPLPPAAPRSRRAEVADDIEWVGRHFIPWMGRRIRRVSSGDGLAPKDRHPALVATQRAPST